MRERRAQFPFDIGRDRQLRREQKLVIDAFARVVFEAPLHVPAANLTARDLSAIPIGAGIVDDGMIEVLSQSVGFSPERLAQRQKANIEMKTAEQEVLNKKQSLLNAYFIAMDNNDSDMLQRTIDKIVRFNSSNPWAAIKGSSLSKSVKEKYRRRMLAQLTGGMGINKKAIGELGGMAAYGNPED